ncbi:hypothetical protein SGFS_025810 [Streptomyces graminofaciens]|uniref:Uncharacterized protein n=1 Tax=Streptomyces graminofaciens TaxID=68212 RepID=A0ABM7F650_9ACTN|nr:hypothetical protein SGFS_025810 [Streptomyces graminofaciens]
MLPGFLTRAVELLLGREDRGRSLHLKAAGASEGPRDSLRGRPLDAGRRPIDTPDGYFLVNR